METSNSIENNQGNPWGLSDTLIFGIIILVIGHFMAYIPYFGFFVLSDTLGLVLSPLNESIEHNGLLLALWTIATMLVTLPLLSGSIYIRRNINIQAYLGCYAFTLTKLCKWVVVLQLFVIATKLFTVYMGRPLGIELITTADSLPLLFIALVFAAPLTDELLFRGFLLTGFRHSKLGWQGGIILSSLCWCVRYTEYDWYNITWVFLLGLILAYAKKDSHSIYLPLILHVLVNSLFFIRI